MNNTENLIQIITERPDLADLALRLVIEQLQNPAAPPSSGQTGQ